MNILYYFQELGSPMFQWQRTHLIDEFERHGCIVEVFNPLLFESPDEANEKLCQRLNKGGVDLFFTNVCYYKMLYVETLQYIKRIGIPSVSLRCDNLVIPFNDRILAPYFDVVWLTAIETKYLYDKWGVKTVFAPYAANPNTFCYSEQQLERKVSFIGTPYGSRSIMINSLTSSGVNVDLFYGEQQGVQAHMKELFQTKYDIIQQSVPVILFNRLRFKEGRHLIRGKIANMLRGCVSVNESEYLTRLYSVHPSEISKYYSKYSLSLASTSTNHTDALREPLKIVNLRNFEIPMSGGVEICKFNEELAGYFEDGKEIIFYDTNEELIDKARYYTQKASDKEIYDLKRAARKRAENEHTWWKRFCHILDFLGIIGE